MKKMNALDWVTMILLIVGGLNWGLVGLFEFDLVATIFGDMSWLSRVIYILVGLSAVYVAVVGCKKCDCGKPEAPSQPMGM
ncbi:MAG: DUF378 domain-containing protein [Patescibacteria group bacterium]